MWWAETRPAPRRRWWERRTPEPEPALRRVVAGQQSPVVGRTSVSIDQDEVGFLLRVELSAQEGVTAVGLRERPQRESSSVRETPITVPLRFSEMAATAIRSDEPTLADRLRVLLAPPLDSLLPGPTAILEWPAPLLDFQIDGVRALIERDRVLLADDMGLGKTVQALAALRILCLQRKVERALLLVPASLADQWRREAAKWAPELRTIVIRGSPRDRAWQWRATSHLTIVSYETFRADFTENPSSPPRLHRWDLVILDEAQRIKNRGVEAAREAKRLERRRSWAMTGTPLENKEDDLASIMEFVDHEEGHEPPHYAPGQILRDRHRELQLRRRKRDVLLQLPPKQVIGIQLELPPGQRATYDRAEREGIVELRNRGETIRIQHILELILRLKQICNFDPVTGESAKMIEIEERLDTLVAEGHRALLFSQYTNEPFGVAAVAARLARFDPLTFTGSLTGGERDRVIQTFKTNDRHKALVLSLMAGGVGLNLQEASYVFHVDRWWNPASERQAEDRSHRMGQTIPVTVFKYTCQNTIEERIQEILVGKQQLFDELVDDVSVDLGSRLTASEMFGLFGLQAPQRATRARSPHPDGLELEDRVARMLSGRGWSVEKTPRSRDGGIDLIARRVDEVGIEQTLYVQCKDHARPVGVEVVRELIGVIPAGTTVQGVLAAPAGVTADALFLAKRRNVVVWDEHGLADLEGGL
jgi:superfamily II DNA or RNA helicase